MAAKQVDSTNIGTLLEALITKVKSFFWRKEETDDTPTAGSDNLVKSGGVFSALSDKYTKPTDGIPASDLAPGVIPPDEVFWAEYGVTTAQELSQAVADGKQLFVNDSGYICTYGGSDGNYHYFFSVIGNITYRRLQVQITTNSWARHSLGVEGTANKSQSVETDKTSTTKYPSTKAVADALAGKQNTIDANHKLAYSLLSGTPPEIFPVTYGTTTQSEILTAVAAGQLPVCKYGDNLYVYAGESSANYSQFTSVLYDTAYRIYVKNSTWGNGSYEVYSKPSGGIPASDIAAGVIPAAPVNADWNANSGLAQILNKPTIPAAPVNADWNATEGLAKILNKPSIPAAQVPSDWDATEGVSRILNKPAIPSRYAGSPSAGGFANKAVAIPFGNVDADSTDTEITATVDNFPTTLTDGVCAFIRNNVVASASGFTLNINGTGAKPVYQTLADASRVSTVFNANSTYLFVYNSTRVEGGCWDLYYGYNSNDNTIGYNLRTNGASAPPAAQKYYRYRLLFTAANGMSLVPANTSSSTSATAAKTVNQAKIDPFGVIFYYSYTSAVNAAASPNASYLWMQYNGIALGYSFNRTGEALEMTARDPVYLKCAPQSDGSAIIDADNPIVQALPTTADGKIYIFLGFAESATAITLYYWHPVYYHDGTRVTNWPGPVIGDIQTALDAIIGEN